MRLVNEQIGDPVIAAINGFAHQVSAFVVFRVLFNHVNRLGERLQGTATNNKHSSSVARGQLQGLQIGLLVVAIEFCALRDPVFDRLDLFGWKSAASRWHLCAFNQLLGNDEARNVVAANCPGGVTVEIAARSGYEIGRSRTTRRGMPSHEPDGLPAQHSLRGDGRKRPVNRWYDAPPRRSWLERISRSTHLRCPPIHPTQFGPVAMPRYASILAAFASIFLSSAVARADAGDELTSAYRTFALEHEGDAKAGELVFQANRKAVCSDCHRITGMEKSGPNLDGIGEKYSRQEMIEHLLRPNLSIKRGYEQVNVLTQDGRLLTGRVEKSNQLVLRIRDPKGERVNLPRNEIKDVRFSEASLMPEGLATMMTRTEFADLASYLCSLKFGIKDGLGPGGKTVSIPRLKEPIRFVPIHDPDKVPFENPVWVGPFPSMKNQLLVVEHQQAKVWRYIRDQDHPRKELFLDLQAQVHIAGDQGLTSLALHPQFMQNGRYFLEHEVREGGVVKTTIVERQATLDRLSDSGQQSVRLLEVEQPAGNHNGGCIAFGPDGMLYAGFGDGGPQKDPEGYSQNPRELLGSFVRIDVDSKNGGKAYSIPPDNPFVEAHRKDKGIRPEVWAIGFREPWRFSFDSLTGDLWVGDVGQSKYEEVLLVNRGENHGWNVREGFSSFSDEFKREGETFTDPLFAYEHGLGFSVTGGHVYRGDPSSSFYGVYIFGDYNTRRIWGLRQKNGRLIDVKELATAPTDVASFGLDENGEILLVSYGGEILHLDLSHSEYD